MVAVAAVTVLENVGTGVEIVVVVVAVTVVEIATVFAVVEFNTEIVPIPPKVMLVPTAVVVLVVVVAIAVVAVALIVDDEVGVVPASGTNPRTTTDHKEGVIEKQGFVWFNAALKDSGLWTAEVTHKIGRRACLDGGTEGQQCKRISDHVLR